MKTHRALLGGLVLGLAALYAACSGDTGTTYPPVPAGGLDGGYGDPDAGTGGPDGGTDGGVSGNTELTDFVRNLIVNQTADDNLPTTTEDKPLVDSEPADAFPPSFFQ